MNTREEYYISKLAFNVLSATTTKIIKMLVTVITHNEGFLCECADCRKAKEYVKARKELGTFPDDIEKIGQTHYKNFLEREKLIPEDLHWANVFNGAQLSKFASIHTANQLLSSSTFYKYFLWNERVYIVSRPLKNEQGFTNGATETQFTIKDVR